LFVPGRHASLHDCGLDTIGAALAMLVPYTRNRCPSLNRASSRVATRVVP
jgi:VanZ family protein